jgi:Cdc6-like AAA superfamily ATPase
MENNHINNLTNSAQKYLDKSVNERIKKCKEQVWIPYPQALNILSELEDLFNHPKKERMPNLLIVGDTNNGKTTIINHFIRKYPSYLDIAHRRPIIKISAPISPSQNALYEKILDELYVPYGINEPTSRKEYQVKKILNDIQTKMIIIDEFQDVFHGDIKRQRAFLSGLKQLGTELQIPIVAVGVWEVQSVMTIDPQISNRFETMKLEKWKLDINFAKLVMSFEKTLPLKEASHLYKDEIIDLLFDMSEGHIGELARILEKASIFALKHNKEKIDKNILKSINYIIPSLRRK